ncbi:ArsR/SmtB family transcription factor [Halorientalis halophila]|uniref:ArsR/SmtB family transcription factor n=1 Tax=Halorientalis halophila TaxID=3108499 RepID=UPI00300BC1AC
MRDHGSSGERDEESHASRSMHADARNDLFRALAHPRRRRILAFLREEGRAVPVEQIADGIATDEAPPERIVSGPDVEAALYHVHLPKLIEAGLLEWIDPDRRAAVHLTPRGRDLPTALPWYPGDRSDTGE